MSNRAAIIYYIIMVPILLFLLYEHLFSDFNGSCSYHVDKFANKMGIVGVSSVSTRVANQFVWAAQDKNYITMGLMVDKNAMDSPSIYKLAHDLARVVGDQRLSLSKNELVGFHSCQAKNNKQIAVTFRHPLNQDKNLFIDLVYKELDNWVPIITGFHFSIADNTRVDPLHQVSLTNLSIKQTIIGIAWIIIPLLMLVSLVLCIKKDYVKYKFLWVLFILFGIGSIDFDWSGQMFFTKLFSVSFLGVGWFKTTCSVPLILKLSVPVGAILFLLKIFLVKIYFPRCKNPTINRLLLKYDQWQERRRIIAEEKWKKHCLDTFGVYHNAHELTQGQVLEVFWKELKSDGYDVTHFNGNTSVREPAKQLSDWDDLGADGFVYKVEEIFGISKKEISAQEYENLKIFGEYADLIMKKAKEKKLA